MKTLEELQKEYDDENNSFYVIKNAHDDKIDRIKNAVVALASYKVGDKVLVIARGLGLGGFKTVPGVIRTVHAMQRYGNKLMPCYRVAKMTKSGAPHASQDVGFSQIDEGSLIPYSEVSDEA